MTVKSSVPGLTTSPTLTAFFAMMPPIGARMTASPSWRSALASRDLASASCASTAVTLAWARSRSRAAIAPALTSCSVRSTSRRATASWLSALRTADVADCRASSSVRVSIRPSSAPRRHGLPFLDVHLEHRAAELGANGRFALRPQLTRENRADDDRALRHRDDVLLADLHRGRRRRRGRLLRFGRARRPRQARRRARARARPVVPAARDVPDIQWLPCNAS